MKNKKLTATIARILAERVREKLAQTSMELAVSHKETIIASDEFKEYETLRAQQTELRKKVDAARQTIKDKYSTPMMTVKINAVYEDRSATVSIAENSKVSVESIRDSILLEDYFADSPITHEELVDNMVAKFLS